MADTIPTFADTVRQQFVIEPLRGPRDTFYYLKRFPEEIYNRSPDSHLYRFLRSMLGDQGVNWIRKNYLQARLIFEELNIELFDLDAFYGDVFGFGRILDEAFDDDPTGLIPRDQWEVIKSKNTRYRNRALDFVNGARAGNTPFGMRLVAKSGLGHEVEIIENYKYLYDLHSDDPLGLDYYGQTYLTQEMVVLPRRELSLSEVQRIAISDNPPPDGGTFVLGYNGEATGSFTYDKGDGAGAVVYGAIPWNATNDMVRLALETIQQIGPGNVIVTGGPGPHTPWDVTFTGGLSGADLHTLTVSSALTSSWSLDPITMSVTTVQNGRQSYDEIVSIPPRDRYHLQEAVDRVRPQTTIMTVADAPGLRSNIDYRSVDASSEYREVIRYVTGNPGIVWPQTGWIVPNTERSAPRAYDDLQHHYQGFHTVQGVVASTQQVGPYPDAPATVTQTETLEGKNALAFYAEPLTVTSAQEIDGTLATWINGIYPIEYESLPGAPLLKYQGQPFWASVARQEDEYLILTFGRPQAVNYLAFEINQHPIKVDVTYDIVGIAGEQEFVPVTPIEPYSNLIPDGTGPNWLSLGLTFTNRKSETLFTSALCINFLRQGYTGQIEVRNLRVGRNVS